MNKKIILISDEKDKENENPDNIYVMRNKNKSFNIDIKYITNKNFVEFFINNERIETISSKKIAFEINIKSYILTPILIINTNNGILNSSILEEKKNLFLNNPNMQIWSFSSSSEANKKKYPNIVIILKDINNIYQFPNVSKIGGIKSFLPIFELISDKKELFEDLSEVILNIIKLNYFNFLETYYSNFYKGYNYLGQKYYTTCKKSSTKILLILSEIFIREEIINDIINSKIYDKEYDFYDTDVDKYFYEIYPYLYDLILLFKEEDTYAQFIFELLVQFMNENHPINDMNNVIKTINEILENNFKEFYQSLNKFEAYKIVSGWFKGGIEDWLRTNTNKKLEFIEKENKKFDLFYIIFKFCDMLFIDEKKSKNIEHLILRYIIINLKTGFIVQAKIRKQSLFYHNVNLLILFLNFSPLSKNNNNKHLIFILDLIKSIQTYKYFKNPIDEEYFNLNIRFKLYKQEETNNEKKEVEYPIKTEEFIEKIIKKYKYPIKVDFGLQLTNLKFYRDIKKELFSWNSTYSNLSFFYEDINEIIKRYENKENKKLEDNKIKYKRCFHLTKDMILPLLEPIIDYNYYETNFSQHNKEKNKFEIFRTNYNDKRIKLNLFINQFDKQNKKYIKCCICKTNYHITGFLFKYDSYIEFFSSCDIYKEKCLGSLGVYSEKTKDYNYYLKLNYEHMNFILKRKYYFDDKALEIYYDNNKSYFLIFEEHKIREEIFKLIIKNFIDIKLNTNDKKEKEIIGKFHINFIKQFINNEEELNQLTNSKEFIINKISNLWKEYKISTLHYLMWINILGTRSYRDLTQYPVFPWIISNYLQDIKILGKEVNIYKNEEFIITKLIEKYLRPLEFPMGMMEINNKSIRRKECYIETYSDLMKDYIKVKGKTLKETKIKIKRKICKTLIIDDNDLDKDIIHLLEKEPEDMELKEDEEKKKKRRRRKETKRRGRKK